MKKIMKLLPVFGFVVGATLVLATSAFTEVSGSDPTYTFEYDTGQPYDIPNVQNRLHWTYNDDASGCDGENEEACTITVTAASVDLSGATPVLNSNFSISAAENGNTNSAYVSTVSDPSAVIVNTTKL